VANDTRRTYLYTAQDIEGPWEKHTIEGFYHDCSLLFDDDDRVYIAYGNRTIRITELRPDLSGPLEGGLDRVAVVDPWKHNLGYEGAHFYKITIIGCLFIGLAAFAVLKLTASGSRPYLLVVRANSDKAIDYTARLLNENNIKNRLSSLVDNGDYSEVIYEIALRGNHQKLTGAIKNLPDVISVSLVDCRN
jgi:hypothetical protein